MAELLLELLSEEIPARMQDRAADDLKRLVCERLEKAGLAFENARAFATPRRLALVVDGLPTAQPDVTEERKGPRVGAPEKAIQGFLGSVGMTRDQVEERETPKGAVLFAVIEKRGRPTLQVLEEIIPSVIESIPWPKSMRWSDYRMRFVRPLHNVVCLFDGEVVNARLLLEPNTLLIFRNVTCGHRFMAPKEFEVTDFEDYREKLYDAYVRLDAAERREVIEQGAALAAKAEGLTVTPDPALVAENAGLVEWPELLMGAIDSAFMDLPPEVLTTTMRSHQKYFTLTDADGKLAPHFLMVANAIAGDGGKQIVAGNERVLRARLADAKFFWDQDRKRTLESRVADLDGVTFHARLGTLGDKGRRIETLAANIAALLKFDAEAAREAAHLCKSDLTTEMVGEFPELQGVMGRYYALGEGKSAAIAEAICSHYSPLGPNDRCPDASVSIAVALADKIDTLLHLFGIGEKPTGSKDPFALRRAALGVIRIVIENDLRIPLRHVFGMADMLHAEAVDGVTWDRDKTIGELLAFFADRLKVHLREKGVRHDLISAVFAAQPDDDLVRLLARVEALGAFVASDDGEHLLTAYRRAANIVRIEEKRDGTSYDGAAVDPELLREADEKAVAERLFEVSGHASAALEREEFASAMEAMATLRGPVDAFFDNVTVNCDDADLRRNRLLLLGQIRATLDRVADFSKIEG